MLYGYPINYRQPPRPDPIPPPAPNRIRLARLAGATYLSLDGGTGYCRRFGEWYECYWDGLVFGAWWVRDGEPGREVLDVQK